MSNTHAVNNKCMYRFISICLLISSSGLLITFDVTRNSLGKCIVRDRGLSFDGPTFSLSFRFLHCSSVISSSLSLSLWSSLSYSFVVWFFLSFQLLVAVGGVLHHHIFTLSEWPSFHVFICWNWIESNAWERAQTQVGTHTHAIISFAFASHK